VSEASDALALVEKTIKFLIDATAVYFCQIGGESLDGESI